MSTSSQNPIACSQSQALLAEAVEGALSAAEMQSFEVHSASCQQCAAMFAEALAGHRWLQQMETIEPPAHLLRNILVATSEKDLPARQAARAAAKPSSVAERMRAALRPLFTPLMQPRIAGSFAMVFFSITVLLNILGVRLSDVRQMDLRPQAVRLAVVKEYYQTRARAARYYDSVKVVYEIQAQLRDLRNALPQQQQNSQQPQPEKKERDNNISHDPQRENRNYVQSNSGAALAMILENEFENAHPASPAWDAGATPQPIMLRGVQGIKGNRREV